MKSFLVSLIVFSLSQAVMTPAKGQEPTKQDIWSTRYIVADGFQTAVTSLAQLASKAENEKAKKGFELLCAAKVFEYWLASKYDPILSKQAEAPNPAVQNLEKVIKRVFRNLNLAQDERKLPIGHKQKILKLDGSAESAAVISPLFTPYFPPPNMTKAEHHSEIMKEFESWISTE